MDLKDTLKSVQMQASWFLYAFIGWMPVVLLGLGLAGGLGYGWSRKEKKDGSGLTVAGWGASGFLAAILVALFLLSGLGQLFFQDASKGRNAFRSYWVNGMDAPRQSQ